MKNTWNVNLKLSGYNLMILGLLPASLCSEELGSTKGHTGQHWPLM